MKRNRPIVAIDGPAGSGKSTVARGVATQLGYTLVDTGALYRCVALAAERAGICLTDGAGLGELAARIAVRFERRGRGVRIWLDGREVTEDIRQPQISQGASRVSAHPQVRRALLDVQRDLGRDGGVVLEGRDIGTVVFPDAEVKVFLSAAPEIRARRRYDELRSAGFDVSLADTLVEVLERDERDQTRSVAPLRPALDAVSIDSAALSVDQVVERIVDLVRAHTGRSGECEATGDE